jgi:hypothetical protein
MRLNGAVAVVAAGLMTLGCGRDGPETHPVSGRVVLTGGDAGQLAGHHVEAVLESDPAVRASGVIGPDGTFALETLDAGAVRKGARAGRYRARVVPAEENEDGKKLRKPPVAARHLKFETSGLSFSVPATEEVKLVVSPR